jgi:hypothetical protein
MKLKRILLGFCRYAIATLIVFGRSVVKKMTGNSYFTNPDPNMDDLSTAIDDVETKASLAQDGSKLAKSNLNEAKKFLITLLRSEAWYVENIAKGDENILISSGFELSKEPEPSQRDDFWVKRGINPGELLIGCVAYQKAGAYIWQVSAGECACPQKKKTGFLPGPPPSERQAFRAIHLKPNAGSGYARSPPPV